MKLFFSLPKHKVFEYKPLYYDPDKERIEQRRKELGLTSDTSQLAGTGAMLRSGAMRARHDEFLQQMEDDRRRQKVRTMLFIFIFSLVAYLVLNGSLSSIVSFFMQNQ